MPTQAELSEARVAWQAAQILDLSPPWDGHPVAADWMRRFATDADPKTDWHLWHMASSDSALVAAHAIQTLHMRRSSLILELPDEVVGRSGHITTQTGSFREKMQFRDFCAHIIKHSSARVDSINPESPKTNQNTA
jgi:hypothetical protein